MSLFKTKEWWRTECGELRETFDGQSLLVGPRLLQPGLEEQPGPGREAIVVASHAGYLRIYDPAVSWDEELNAPGPYKSTDLVVEAKLAEAILDVKTGKFISGSQEERLAILTPTKLVVYTVSLTKGSIEHGDRCELLVAYEHQMKRFPASLTVGPFGGAQGRDFMCVQCLDGTLLFYEQESYAFSRSLKSRLLPEPLIYVARSDVFVTLGSGWILECYRYQNIAEVGRKEDAEGTDTSKGIVPDWSYNIGEPIIDINAVVLTSFEVGIIVLGERSLYCLGDSCTSIKTSKRLEYSPLCFCAYVIEPDGKPMTMVVADTSTLMIYEGTSLKWSAQLPFAPVAVARANLQNLEGAIVILSEDGRLEACYLGSEPSLFVAPPMHRRGFDYVAAERDLLELRRQRKLQPTDGQVTNAAVDAELTINAVISPELLPSPRQPNYENAEEKDANRQSSMCKIEIEFTSYTTLQDLQIFFQATEPLVLTKDELRLPNLCDTYKFETCVYLNGDEIPYSPEVCITATYENEKGELGVVVKEVQVPPRMLLRPCAAETGTAPFSLTIKSAEPVLNFSQLFPEFVGEYTSRQITNSLGLQHARSGPKVTLLASGLMQNRYRIQASDGLAVPLVFQQLVARIKDKAPAAAAKLSSSLGQQQLQLLQDKVDAHFEIRLRIREDTKEIGLLTTQLRNIEKRMLRATRERNSRSLAATGLPALLDSTYRAIFALLDRLQAARADLEKAAHELMASVKLVLQVLQLSLDEEKYAMLESALSYQPQNRDDIDWEEVTDVSLQSLNRAISQRGGDLPDSQLPVPLSRFETTREVTKLKKRLVHALEKLAAGASTSGGVSASIRESPAEELAAAD